MPIYKGNKEITAIYKGDKPISAIYKGDTLIFSSGTWEQYLYEFIYNSLVPTTINNKQVKNKARVNTIYANGVIENQLVQNGNFESTSGWSALGGTLSVLNNVGTITLNNAGSANRYQKYITPIANHTYLVRFDIKSNKTSRGYIHFGDNYSTNGWDINTTWTTKTFLLTPTTTTNVFRIYINYGGNYLSNGDTVDLRNVNIVDLTQRHPSNTPTSLSDNRIQKILNSGYIPYNIGTYKGTDISEISSESFNIWDEEWELGTIVGGQDNPSNSNIRSKNYINVLPNSNYYWKAPINNGIAFYDKNKNYISTGYYPANTIFATPSTCYYVRFYCGSAYGNTYNNDICINVSSSLNGTYKPHKTFTPIALKYQGNGALDSHDTLEITSTEWVFTKNTFKITLSGSETVDNLAQYGTNFMGITNLFTTDTQPPHNYLPMFNKRAFNKGSIGNLPEGYCYTYGRNFYYNIGTNDQQANIDFITGLEIIYQLATPQVIRIPRKHLGVVDLGTLDYVAQGNGRFVSSGLTSTIKPVSDNANIGNIICSKYLRVSYYNISTDMSICVHTSGNIYIQDNSKSNMSATDFKNAMSGTYLFYETTDEVADIPFTVEVEAGGTITTDSEVLPNIEFNIKCK